jgi:hypothetical protein
MHQCCSSSSRATAHNDELDRACCAALVVAALLRMRLQELLQDSRLLAALLQGPLGSKLMLDASMTDSS